MIKNQLTWKTTKAHAEQIRLASLEWEIPKQALKPNQRKATMAVPVETDSDIKSSSESDDDTPLAKLAKMYRREIETSDEEDNIPLMELGKLVEHNHDGSCSKSGGLSQSHLLNIRS